MRRGFAPPSNPPGRVHMADGRAAYRVMCRLVPLVSDYSHICFLLDLMQLLLLMPLLLSRSAHGHAVRLKIPLSLRTVRVPTITLPSPGSSCCCTSQGPQGYHPPCVQLRLGHRKVPTMVVQQPSLQYLRWVAIDPRRTPLVPRARCWSSSQPALPEQGHSPISSPMNLHRSIIFASSRVLVSPVQSALLTGSSRTDGFHVLIIGLLQGREQVRVTR